jgi:hypothetical protein
MARADVSPTKGRRVKLALVAIALTGLAACGGGSSKRSPPAQQATGGAAASGTESLAGVDACTLLTADDFAAATDKVQPAGFPPSKYTLTTRLRQQMSVLLSISTLPAPTTTRATPVPEANSLWT